MPRVENNRVAAAAAAATVAEDAMAVCAGFVGPPLQTLMECHIIIYASYPELPACST